MGRPDGVRNKWIAKAADAVALSKSIVGSPDVFC